MFINTVYGKILLRSYMLFFLTSFFANRLFISIFADNIPGQPYYDFSIFQWIGWLFSIKEISYLIVHTAIIFVLGLYWDRNFNKPQLVWWGLFIGLFIAIIFSPFDYWSNLDLYLESIIPALQNKLFDTILAIIEIIFFLIFVPMVSAWANSKFNRGH